jgi:hypothetical protein
VQNTELMLIEYAIEFSARNVLTINEAEVERWKNGIGKVSL